MVTQIAVSQNNVRVQDVIVTPELVDRPAPELDHAQVKRAILELATKMVDSAEEVLPRFVDFAMELAGGVAAGISVFESEARPPIFRWAFLRGSLAAFEGVTTPRDFSPCGVTLDQPWRGIRSAIIHGLPTPISSCLKCCWFLSIKEMASRSERSGSSLNRRTTSIDLTWCH